MKNKVSGFSLLEMSVVVLISGMIMTAILNLIPVIYKTTKSAMDSKKMEIVENAFYAFVAKNKRLPRPANMEDKINTNTSSFGIEQEDGMRKAGANDSLYIGTLPAVTLGLSPEYVYDEFGNKFVYIVNINCTKTKGLLKCDTNSDDLITMDTNGIKTKDIVFTIVAQGYNKKYSYAMNSSKQNTTSDYNKAEISNSYDFFTGTVYDKVYSSRNFDDTLIFGTNSFIMNKLSMYDIGCVINMNSTEISNNVTMWIL